MKEENRLLVEKYDINEELDDRLVQQIIGCVVIRVVAGKQETGKLCDNKL